MLPVDNRQQSQTSAESRLRVEFLGVPRIFWNGDRLALVRRQARAILFRLAYAAVPVGREELADLLWPAKEPAAARRNIVRLLSSLRGELPNRDMLQTDRTAVWLDPAGFGSDVHDFVRLTSGAAVQDWETAVTLYRGPFLSGFVLPNSPAFEEWQQTISHDLERRYLETLARLVKNLQSSGAITQAIEHANRYLAVDNLAETIHCLLITLYAAAGRRTAALQQYSRCVEILHHELGVEPLPETRAAFEAARDGIAVSSPRPKKQPNWSTLPGLDLPLTGRDEAWRDLENAYSRRQTGGVILISGAPGIGKSRLMQEFASGQSSLVLVGNCHTGSQALSFQPLVQALRQGLHDPRQIDLVKRIWLAELSVLLPELRDEIPNLPPPLHLAPDQAQARLLEAISQVFRALAANSRLLLCLDDLHAADEGTYAWLQYAARQLAGSRVCLLVTFRAQEAHKLAEWQRTLSRAGLASQIRLQALNSQSVETLLELAGTADEIAANLAPRLHEGTGGNAFFLLETIRELLESGGLRTQASTVPLPQTVREAVLRRADRLAPLARQVLDMAAVLAPLLEGPLLAQTSARSELEVAEALDDLVLRQFLLLENGRFRFQHDLTQEVIYDAISDWRLRLLHRRAAQTLEQIPSSALQGLLGTVALHYELAGDFDQALDRYLNAVDAARHVHAHQEAVGFLQRAIDLLPKVNARGESTKSFLYETLADLLILTGEYAEARDALSLSAATLSEKQSLDQARIQFKIGRSWSSQVRFEEAAHSFRKAAVTLQNVRDQDSREWRQIWLDIKLALANLFYLDNRLDELSALCTVLHEAVDQHGSLRQQADFYSTLVMLNNRRLRFAPSEQSLAYARKALKIAEQMADKSLVAWKTFSVGFQLLWLGELDDAEKMISDSLEQAEEIGDLSLQNRAITYLIIALRLQGNVTRVRPLVQQAKASTKDEGTRFYMGAAEANDAWLAYRSGQIDESEMRAREALNYWANLAYPFEWQALFILLAIALQRGDLETAVVHAKRLISPNQQRLPEPIIRYLKRAVDIPAQYGKGPAIGNSLDQAIPLAKEQGYL